jgi:hypothetical protein
MKRWKSQIVATCSPAATGVGLVRPAVEWVQAGVTAQRVPVQPQALRGQ